MQENLQTRLKRRLGAKSLWTRTLIWFVTPFYATFTFAFDALRLGEIKAVWLWLGVITFVELLVLSFIVVKLLPEKFWQQQYSWLLNLLLAFTLGGIKNLSVAVIAEFIGAEKNINLIARFIGGGVLGSSLILFFVITLGSRVEHRKVMADLSLARTQLERHSQSAPAMVSNQQLMLIDETKASILPELAKIKSLLTEKNQVSTTLDALRNVIQNRVRPLSQTFHDRAVLLANDEREDPRLRLREQQIPAKFKFSESINIGLPSAFYALGAVATSAILYGEQQAAWAVLAAAGFTLIIWLARLLLQPVGVTSRSANVAFTLIIATVAATVASAVFYLNAPQNTHDFLMLGTLFGTSYLVTLASFYFQTLENSRRAIEIETRALNRQLKRELSIFEQQLKLNSMRWSYMLHGTVQPALVAAVTRLSGIKKPSKSITDEVLSDLKRVEEAIQQPPETSIDIESEMLRLSENWHNICTLHFAVSSSASSLLAEMPATAFCINEIVKEGISNAYRHGKATQLWVSVHVMNKNSIELIMRNDGVLEVTRKKSRGLGTKMYDELSLEWSIRYDKAASQTIVRVLVPISKL